VAGEDIPLMNVQEAAVLLNVHPNTIRRWANAHLLHGSRVGTRGDWRFTTADVHAMVRHTDVPKRSPDAVTNQGGAQHHAEQLSVQGAQQAQAFDVTLAAIKDFVYTFDITGRFIYANKPLLELLERFAM